MRRSRVVEQRIRILAFHRRLRRRFQTYPGTQSAFSCLINASMANGAPQPAGRMRRTLNLAPLPVELQEHILREFFGSFAIAQKTHRDAVHQRLILGHDPAEIQIHIRYYG